MRSLIGQYFGTSFELPWAHWATMEEGSKEKYFVGQHEDSFFECEWRQCLVTLVKVTLYYIYIMPGSIHHRTERHLLTEDSFRDDDIIKELNVSVLSSDDQTLFIMPLKM